MSYITIDYLKMWVKRENRTQIILAAEDLIEQIAKKYAPEEVYKINKKHFNNIECERMIEKVAKRYAPKEVKKILDIAGFSSLPVRKECH